MTPFEQAEENVRHLAEGLNMCSLIQGTLKDCEGLTEQETDLIWTAILALLEMHGKFDDVN